MNPRGLADWRIGSAGWVSRKPESAAGSVTNSCGLAPINRASDEKGKSPSTLPVYGSVQKNLVPTPSVRLEVAIARDKGECFSPSHPDKGGVQFQGRGARRISPRPEEHLSAPAAGLVISRRIIGISIKWVWLNDESTRLQPGFTGV